MKTETKKSQPISESRKIRKPMMEKRRRARINDSLETLKQILLESTTTLKRFRGKNGQRTTKLEKADILEMTVSYIQDLLKVTKRVQLENSNCKDNPQDGCVTFKLSGGEVLYLLPSSTVGDAENNLQKKKAAKVENVWRPW